MKLNMKLAIPGFLCLVLSIMFLCACILLLPNNTNTSAASTESTTESVYQVSVSASPSVQTVESIQYFQDLAFSGDVRECLVTSISGFWNAWEAGAYEQAYSYLAIGAIREQGIDYDYTDFLSWSEEVLQSCGDYTLGDNRNCIELLLDYSTMKTSYGDCYQLTFYSLERDASYRTGIYFTPDYQFIPFDIAQATLYQQTYGYLPDEEATAGELDEQKLSEEDVKEQPKKKKKKTQGTSTDKSTETSATETVQNATTEPVSSTEEVVAP